MPAISYCMLTLRSNIGILLCELCNDFLLIEGVRQFDFLFRCFSADTVCSLYLHQVQCVVYVSVRYCVLFMSLLSIMCCLCLHQVQCVVYVSVRYSVLFMSL